MIKPILFSIAFSVLGLFTLAQTTIHVPDDQPTIQDGIDAADDGDTVLVAQGIYFENIEFGGKAIWVTSHWLVEQDSAHILNTIIDGSSPENPSSGSVVRFTSGEDTTSVLCGFTITGGTGSYNVDWDAWGGGGILVMSSGAKIIHNRIVNNHINTNGASGFGGGLDIEPGAEGDLIILRDNLIGSNQIINELGTDALSLGGGVEIYQNRYIIERNVIVNNYMKGTGDGKVGGGLDISNSSGIINGNTIGGNEIYNYGSEEDISKGAGLNMEGMISSGCTITDNIITNNSITGLSTSNGGGLHIYNWMESDSIFIEGNLIANNIATKGGGMSLVLRGRGCYIANNIISDNTAHESGGGIRIIDQLGDLSKTTPTRVDPAVADNPQGKSEPTAMLLVNNTIVGNTSTIIGGGIYNQSEENDLLLFNNIFYGNQGLFGNDLSIEASDFTTYIYNNDINTDEIDGAGNWLGDDNISEDPDFQTGGYKPDCGSQCIDAGVEYVDLNGSTYYAPEMDFVGSGRPTGNDFDIGAYEMLCTSLEKVTVQEQEMLNIYPNPVQDYAKVVFELPEAGDVTISILDLQGRELFTACEGRFDKGTNDVELGTGVLNPGIYFCTLKIKTGILTRKMIVIE